MKRLVIMGLAFVSDTKHRNESFPLIFHARLVSAGLSPTGGLLTERSRVEEKRKTWLALNTRYLNPAWGGRLCLILCLLCVISAFPSRGNRRVSRGLTGAVHHQAGRCYKARHFSNQPPALSITAFLPKGHRKTHTGCCFTD